MVCIYAKGTIWVLNPFSFCTKILCTLCKENYEQSCNGILKVWFLSSQKKGKEYVFKNVLWNSFYFLTCAVYLLVLVNCFPNFYCGQMKVKWSCTLAFLVWLTHVFDWSVSTGGKFLLALINLVHWGVKSPLQLDHI